MCKERSFDIMAIAVSLVLAVGLTLLDLFGLLAQGPVIPAPAAGFAALSLLLYAILRERCALAKGVRLVVAALLLLLIALLTLVLAAPVAAVVPALHFLIFTLTVYTAFALGSVLMCEGRENCLG